MPGQSSRLFCERLAMPRRLDAAHSIVLRTGVPDGWKEVAVAELARIVGGGTPDRQRVAFWRDGTVPWITPTDLTANGAKFISEGAERISTFGLENSNATLVPRGSIVFSHSRNCWQSSCRFHPAYMQPVLRDLSSQYPNSLWRLPILFVALRPFGFHSLVRWNHIRGYHSA